MKLVKDMKKDGLEFYTLDNILAKKALYNIIFGERSNGKSYAVLLYILTDYVKNGNQGAILRRWKEDLRGKRGQQVFDCLEHNHYGINVVSQLTGGKYQKIHSYSGSWYLATIDAATGKAIPAGEPFA